MKKIAPSIALLTLVLAPCLARADDTSPTRARALPPRLMLAPPSLLAAPMPPLSSKLRTTLREDSDAPPKRVYRKHRVLGLMIGGIVAIGVSVAPITGGAHLLKTALRPGGEKWERGIVGAFGALFTMVGIGMIGGGTVMAVLGGLPDSGRVRANEAAIPKVSIGPGGGTLQWTF